LRCSRAALGKSQSELSNREGVPRWPEIKLYAYGAVLLGREEVGVSMDFVGED
jgi:hypothetical protein